MSTQPDFVEMDAYEILIYAAEKNAHVKNTMVAVSP
jgi:hypothetical protein